jgi:hypothetical protein
MVPDGKAAEKKRENPYKKTEPFYGDACLMIHRHLHEKNYEYVFLVNEKGNKEVGVFIVLL